MALPRRDVDLAGMFKSCSNMGFTTIDCVQEVAGDNPLAVVDMTMVKISLVPPTAGERGKLIVANDGEGMTEEQLKEAQVMWKHKPAGPTPGRFGIGYAASRSFLSDNKDKCLWLSCHTDIPEDAAGEELYELFGDHFSYIQIDMDATMEEGRLNYRSGDEMPRRAESIWEKYAINHRKTGSVISFPLSPEKFDELNKKMTHADITQNLRYAFAFAYRDFIAEGIHIVMQDQEIPELPDIRERIPNAQCKRNYTFRPCKSAFKWRANKEISKFIIKDSTEQQYATYQTPRGQRKVKKLDEHDILTLVPIASLGEVTVKSTFVHKAYLEAVLEAYRPYLKAMGIEMAQNGNKIQAGKIQRSGKSVATHLLSNYLKRSKKRTILEKDRPKGGEWCGYRCSAAIQRDVMTEYSITATDGMDDEMGTMINKNRVGVIKHDLLLSMGKTEDELNVTHFKKMHAKWGIRTKNRENFIKWYRSATAGGRKLDDDVENTAEDADEGGGDEQADEVSSTEFHTADEGNEDDDEEDNYSNDSFESYCETNCDKEEPEKRKFKPVSVAILVDMDKLSGIVDLAQQNICINGNGDMMGVKEIYTSAASTFMLGQKRGEQWSAHIESLDLTFDQYINGIRDIINRDNSPVYQENIHVLVKYFKDK